MRFGRDESTPASTLLHRWALGVAVVTPLFVVVATILRGWRDTAGWG